MNGTFKGTFGWTSEGRSFESGERSVIWVGTFSGPFSNVSPGGFMDGTSWVCLGTTENQDDITQASNGELIVTDPDGSKACATWTGRREIKAGEISGRGRWTRGSGKWTGITGEMTYTGKAILGTQQGSLLIEGDWQINASAESAS